MEKIKIHDKYFKKYIKSDEIEKRVLELSGKLNDLYRDRQNPPLFLSILTGSFVFASDLIRNLSIPAEITFIKLSSYDGTSSTGKVKQIMGLSTDIKGRDIVIVEDIVETGNTMEELLAILKEKGAASIRICAVFFKPDNFKKNFKVDFPLFIIPNDFIVGYGLDYNQLGRQYKDIYIIEE